MANVKISNLTAATTPVAGTEVLPIVQSGATVKVSIANLTAGRSVSATGLALAGSTSGTVTLAAKAVAGSSTFRLPAADGTSGQAMVTDGSGNLSFATAGASAATPNALGTVYGKTDTSSLVFLGYQAGNSNTGTNNTAIGIQAGYGNTSGTENTYIGPYSGYYVTTGSKNTIIGRYSALNAPISQTGSNFIVLSDGDGNVGAYTKTGQTFVLPSGTISSGTGIAFPATQSASSDANTLDDYEEGTWTPTLGGNTTYSTRTGTYVKIGRLVTLNAYFAVTSIGTGSTTQITGIPFTAASGGSGVLNAEYTASLATAIVSITAFVNSNQIDISSRTAAATSASTNAIFGNGTGFEFTCTYIATA
jgi:hypothetical protein